MPFGSIGTYACRALQANYVDYFGKNAMAFKTGGSTALIKYLLSPQNTAGFRKIEVTSIPGKLRPVAFMVDNPFCFTVCSPAVDCTTVRTVISNPSQEVVFDLTANPFRVCDGASAPQRLTFTRADLAKYCTVDDQTYIQNQIMRYLMRFEEALDSRLATLLLTFVGTNATGGAITTLPFFTKNTTTNSSVLNPDALWWMDQNFQDIEGIGQYALVGGKILNKIMQTQKWTGLNAAGIDLSQVNDMMPFAYYDRNMDAIAGQDNFLQLSPGAVQLVTYAENAGPYKTEVTDLYSNGNIISPTTGLQIDWDWRYDYDCKAWTFEAFLHAELAVNKAGGCGALSTTNGIIRYADCSNSMVIPACPTP
jgi:hypothetical protein